MRTIKSFSFTSRHGALRPGRSANSVAEKRYGGGEQKARKVLAGTRGEGGEKEGWGECSHLASYRVKHKGGGVWVRS